MENAQWCNKIFSSSELSERKIHLSHDDLKEQRTEKLAYYLHNGL